MLDNILFDVTALCVVFAAVNSSSLYESVLPLLWTEIIQPLKLNDHDLVTKITLLTVYRLSRSTHWNGSCMLCSATRWRRCWHRDDRGPRSRLTACSSSVVCIRICMCVCDQTNSHIENELFHFTYSDSTDDQSGNSANRTEPHGWV